LGPERVAGGLPEGAAGRLAERIGGAEHGGAVVAGAAVGEDLGAPAAACFLLPLSSNLSRSRIRGLLAVSGREK
jgi:hypothetical protein